ncbi:S-layer homology domain-containing protein [Feifania hominis]|uniref:S-layer homology domain-containing protein n=1 Tax=Feifania hominis TaxID=2763660 RepID=A0A926DC06_9FIRM|nr:S-layer homology domain-containing protein [Feifania hominis]MBC8535441.1 S-layer homology domain-containing protein [Feifania hominis]
MRKKLFAGLFGICLLLGLLATAAFAAPQRAGTGLTADDPIAVEQENLVIRNDTYYGISKTWFASLNLDKADIRYFSIQIPNTVKTIAANGFTDAYSNEKDRYGAVTYNDDLGRYHVAAIDFSQATNLTTIKSQAAMSSPISGVLDLSQTRVTDLEKNAFKSCVNLTGVILPATLQNIGSKDSGSVFYGCTGLQYVRTADSDSDAVFELPDHLLVIGRQSFYQCSGLPANTTVEIPASVNYVGSEVFHYTTPVTTIVVKTDDANAYDGGAFKSTDHGLGKRLIVFQNSAARSTFSPSGLSSYRNACTYEFTLHYGTGPDAKTEPKLHGQAVNVCKAPDGDWFVDEEYTIPDAKGDDIPVGYVGGWVYNNALLTSKTVLKPDGDDLYLDIRNILQAPTVEFIVNGETIPASDTYPKLRVSPGAEIGVKVSHAIQSDPDADVKVKFEYQWIDVWQGGREGPRMEEDGFGRYNLWDKPDVTNTIRINGSEDERTSAGNYTDQDYGDGYYLVVIYGYAVPKTGGQWERFYQSANTVIGSDPGRTVNTAYLFDVTIAEPVTVTPADITIYTGGEGYTGVVNDAGQQVPSSNGLPEPGYYITLPKRINEQLGGDANAADLSKILKFTYQDGQGREREWKLELYGTDAHSSNVEGTDRQRYIYRVLPGIDETGQEIPLRLQFADYEGNVIVSDVFSPNVEEQYREYDMGIYPGDLETGRITAEIDLGGGQTVFSDIVSSTGKLVVRGLTDDNVTVEIVGDESGLSARGITAVAPDDIAYYVNGSNVEVADPSGVKLLIDEVLDDSVLTDYIEQNMTEHIPTGDYAYEQKYFDLVDTRNGNTYLTIGADQVLTIYWPIPNDFDDARPFYMVHFEALDRNYSHLDQELSAAPPKIISAELATVGATKYIKFETESFSPFVLVYGKKSGGSGETDPHYTLRYDTNGGQILKAETKRYSWTKEYEQLPVPVRNGHTFEGWYLDSKLTNLVREDVKVNRATVTLYAGWSKNMGDPDNNGVSSWLNTEDHNSYLNGYGNGTFRPNGNMTRAEAAQMFYNLLLDRDIPLTASFSDVTAGTWYTTAVNALASLGIVNGTGNNQFEPDRPITRAEFTVIAMRFADGVTGGENVFSDVSLDDWFYRHVIGSTQYGWITGYSDGTFRPDNTITRAEATAVVNRMLNRSADKIFVDRHSKELRPFVDLSQGHWGYYQIVEATNTHDYTRGDDGEVWVATK